MPFGTTFQNDLAKLLFQAVAIANIADNAATSPLTNLFLSLHTANPNAGNQTTNEAAYTSYARVTIARTSGGWSVAGAVVTPVATVSFPAATGGSETETYAAVGTLTSGAGKVLASGPISPTIVVSNGVTPKLTTASSIDLSASA